jgi:Rps23 Pro-64 3,4-dihydroxylase Tpa1-like proline 4-hydroxylase
MAPPPLWPRLDELERDFLAARPFRHIVVDNFLDSRLCQSLVDEFPKFDPQNAVSETGATGRKAVHANLRTLGPAYRQFDALVRNSAFLKQTGQVTNIPDLLYDPQYVGGGTHENLDGQELDIHVDFNYHPANFRHRRLNLIVFLNAEWSESWGGCLELCADPWNPAAAEVARILPLANRAVLFETTEHSWHGFSRITLPPEKQDLSRRSIAVYFYTQQRPDEETAAPHATVYIPRPLPAQLQVGHTMTEWDVAELRRIAQRRDDQVRFLYERELGYATLIRGITNSVSFRLGRLLTWPVRALRKR